MGLSNVSEDQVVSVNWDFEAALNLHTPRLVSCRVHFQSKAYLAVFNAGRVDSGEIFDTNGDTTVEKVCVDGGRCIVVVNSNGLEGVHRGSG